MEEQALSAPIRWDIFEEHLDEASFLRQLWEAALRSPSYTLAGIAEGPEGRMLAHLDGLVLGGSRVAKKLLLPALGSNESGPVFAAAFALLASEDGDYMDDVLNALPVANPQSRAALRRALAVVPVKALGKRLAALAPEAIAIQSDLLEVLACLRIDSGLRLDRMVGSPDPATQALAIRLSRVFSGRLDPEATERALGSSNATVRAAALEAGLVTGARGAFTAAEATVAQKGPGFTTAALVLGLSGDEKSVAALIPALEDKVLRHSTSFAIGFSGRISAADALLRAMSDDELAPIAAEGFAAITGLGVKKEFAKPVKGWNPEGKDEIAEEYGPEADLPKPDTEAIGRWWKQARPKLDPAKRWLRGQLWHAEGLLRELELGPAWRRQALALELEVRTQGQNHIAWDSLSARQREEMRETRAAGSRISLKPIRETAR
jgi:uncharacterized protein (TIGR02270 family)